MSGRLTAGMLKVITLFWGGAPPPRKSIRNMSKTDTKLERDVSGPANEGGVANSDRWHAEHRACGVSGRLTAGMLKAGRVT